MKFVLFVEGRTEKAVGAFLARWLGAQLTAQVGVQVVSFEGAPEMVQLMPERAARYLHAPKQEVLGVIGLLDYHNVPLDFPKAQASVVERIAWAKLYLERQVGQPEFRQFFAVHETEAWLLSQPSIFPQAARPEIETKAWQPETVNSQEPPARLLNRLYRARLRQDYKKVTDGGALFAKLDPAIAFAKCPHLRAMLEEMKQMAQDLGLR